MNIGEGATPVRLPAWALRLSETADWRVCGTGFLLACALCCPRLSFFKFKEDELPDGLSRFETLLTAPGFLSVRRRRSPSNTLTLTLAFRPAPSTVTLKLPLTFASKSPRGEMRVAVVRSSSRALQVKLTPPTGLSSLS